MKEIEIKFPFDKEKGKAVIQYVLKKVGSYYPPYDLLRLIYLADRYHVRKYARPVSYDVYYAESHGPVPLNLKKIINPNDPPSFIQDLMIIDMLRQPEDITIDMAQFSRTDKEAIDFVIKNIYTKLPPPFLRFPDHLKLWVQAYPEWVKHKDKLTDKNAIPIKIDYRDFLINAKLRKPLKDPFPPLTEEEQNDIYEEMVERSIAFGWI